MEILLMNPYDGYDDRITNLIEKMSGKRVQTCPNGACPIRKPVKMISDEKINEDIQRVLDNDNVKEVMIPVLTDKDEKIITNISKEYGWDRNPEVIINIVKIT
jgi:hypothetical protein